MSTCDPCPAKPPNSLFADIELLRRLLRIVLRERPMLAAVFKKAGEPWSIETIPDPDPGEAEVVIEVGRCGICGTDLHMTSGSAWDFPSGTVLGHEYAGTIVAIGRDAEGYKVGDIVTALPAAGCGHCDPCQSGNTLLCREVRGYIGG